MEQSNATMTRPVFEQKAISELLPDSFHSHLEIQNLQTQEQILKTLLGISSQQNSPKPMQKVIATHILAHANTVFPITLFPDTINIDTSKVSIIKRSFFMTSQAFSIRIEDILDVNLSLGPFFGSIKIHTRFYDQDKSLYFINWLKRSDAIKLKHILHGYVIARHNGMDLSHLTKEQQLSQMIALGHE